MEESMKRQVKERNLNKILELGHVPTMKMRAIVKCSYCKEQQTISATNRHHAVMKLMDMGWCLVSDYKIACSKCLESDVEKFKKIIGYYEESNNESYENDKDRMIKDLALDGCDESDIASELLN
jgi:anaerobic ribonucleoside-triphosphate reductase